MMMFFLRMHFVWGSRIWEKETITNILKEMISVRVPPPPPKEKKKRRKTITGAVQGYLRPSIIDLKLVQFIHLHYNNSKQILSPYMHTNIETFKDVFDN